MVNQNFFIRTVINEILGLIATSIVLAIVIPLLSIYVKDSAWIIVIIAVAYLALFFTKIGKIRSLHHFITGVEDRIFKDNVHNASKEYWKF